MKFEQIEVGMLLTEGLVVRTMEAGTTKFWGDERSITMFYLNDSFYGTCSRAVKEDEEFTILHPTGCSEYKDAGSGGFRISRSGNARQDKTIASAGHT